MTAASPAPLYGIEVAPIGGDPHTLEKYRGKVLLIVNTASQCGFTPQYEGLEQVYRRFRDRGFEILAFPCNQFGRQEPGTESEIVTFCERFEVSFPLHGKVDVNGAGAHPLYRHLKKEKAGFLGTRGIKWNFTKFLVDRDGEVVGRFGSVTTPEALAKKIEAIL